MLLFRSIQYKREALLTGIGLHHVVDLCGDQAVQSLHLLLVSILRVLRVALELPLFVVDDSGFGSALGVGKTCSLSFQLLGQGFNLIVERLDCVPLRLVLFR